MTVEYVNDDPCATGFLSLLHIKQRLLMSDYLKFALLHCSLWMRNPAIIIWHQINTSIPSSHESTPHPMAKIFFRKDAFLNPFQEPALNWPPYLIKIPLPAFHRP